MNPWGNADRFLAIRDTADRRSDREDLVAEIVAGLSLAGEYAACLDLQPTQRVADFNWAARQAGRRLGIRVDVSSRVAKGAGQVHVRVRVIPPLC